MTLVFLLVPETMPGSEGIEPNISGKVVVFKIDVYYVLHCS